MSEDSITILAVDDDADALFALEGLLVRYGYQVITASNGLEAVERTRKDHPDLVLLDVMMPEMTGYQATEVIKNDPVCRYIPVVLLTSRDDLEDIVKGFEQGADDYIRKPFQKEELLARLKAVMRTKNLYRELESTNRENKELREKVTAQFSFGNIIGKSASMREVFSLVGKVKDAEVPVLVTGESGTGKELIANALHYNSPRRDNPFVIQNCSALNENLLESELFGHVKGAFTGAVKDKQGLFQAADGGTFFLDELGEMSPALQVKLLRVLQEGTFMPVGGTEERSVNVRVVAATNRDLKEMVSKGTFREDLYYRLNVVNVMLPPLRERRVDIPLLVEHFLELIASRGDGSAKELEPETLRVLCDYDWPGNIRELQNEVERLVLMSGVEPRVTTDALSPHVKGSTVENARGRRLEGKLKDAIETLEKNMIFAALERTAGNKSEAARELGISRSNLISKVQNYGLEE